MIPGKEAAGVRRIELFEELSSGGIDHLDVTTRDSRVYILEFLTTSSATLRSFFAAVTSGFRIGWQDCSPSR